MLLGVVRLVEHLFNRVRRRVVEVILPQRVLQHGVPHFLVALALRQRRIGYNAGQQHLTANRTAGAVQLHKRQRRGGQLAGLPVQPLAGRAPNVIRRVLVVEVGVKFFRDGLLLNAAVGANGRVGKHGAALGVPEVFHRVPVLHDGYRDLPRQVDVTELCLHARRVVELQNRLGLKPRERYLNRGGACVHHLRDGHLQRPHRERRRGLAGGCGLDGRGSFGGGRYPGCGGAGGQGQRGSQQKDEFSHGLSPFRFRFRHHTTRLCPSCDTGGVF